MNKFHRIRNHERSERDTVESILEADNDVRVDYRGRDLISAEGKMIPVRAFETTSCNCMLAETGTNGHCGGDSGCITYIRVRDLASTQVRGISIRDGALEIILEGDSELDTAVTVLEGLALLLRKTKEDAEALDFSESSWISYEEKENAEKW